LLRTASNECQSIAARLPLTAGAVYTRNADSLAKKQVEKLSRRPRQNVWIFEDVTPQKNLGLAIAYGVIYERTELSINGRIVFDPDDTTSGFIDSDARQVYYGAKARTLNEAMNRNTPHVRSGF
jgi:hypothetical protein